MGKDLLVPDREDPTVLIDLSNVCRDGDRAYWAHFEALMRAWRRHVEREPRGIAFFDATLPHLLSSGDKAELRRAEARGYAVRSVGSADTDILELADRTSARIVSNDAFRGHRRAFPWIQNNTERFYGWRFSSSGEASIFIRDMGKAGPFTVSREAERDDLKGRRLDPRKDRPALERDYRCVTPTCLNAQLYPERLGVPPRRNRNDALVCPGCEQPLEEVGTRAKTLEVVFESRTEELGRVVLEEGAAPLVVGRGLLEPRASDETLAKALRRLSRRHVSLELWKGLLVATDLESRNGTRVRRRDHDRRAWKALEELTPGEPDHLNPRDELVLAGACRVRCSGQRFPYAVGDAPPGGDDGRRTSTTESR